MITQNTITTEQIFVSAYTQYRELILQYILRLAGNQSLAEDLCQETFATLWEKSEKFSKIDDIGAYLFRSARNEFIDHHRKEKNKRIISEHIYRESGFDINNVTEEFIYQKELEAIVQQAIQSLPPARKRVYLLCKIEGFSYNQAAEMLGKSVCTIREMMRVASIDLRKYINAQTGMARKSNTVQKKGVLNKSDFAKVKALKAA